MGIFNSFTWGLVCGSLRCHPVGYRERSVGTNRMNNIAHFAALAVFGFVAAFWLLYGMPTALGSLKLPWLKDFAPARDADCPRISMIFAARDEEEKLPAALSTMMALDYPHLEIIGVDDRSTDRTSLILEEFAARDGRLKPVHVR